MKFFDQYCQELNQTLQSMDGSKLQQLAEMLQSAAALGRHVYVLGNGGSCASASHWVCDMGKGASVAGKPRIKITALADNGSILTALGNDLSYDEVFAYQLQSLAEREDVIVALSASGSSPNLVSAFEYTRGIGCHNVCIVGDMNGRLLPLSELAIVVPSKNYGVIEDVHMIINHALSQYIRQQNER